MTDTRIETWLAERRSIHAAAMNGPWEADLDQHGETRGFWPTRPGEETIIGAYVAADGFDSVGYALGSDEDLTAIVDAHNHLPTFVAVVGMVLDRHRPEALYQTADQCENDDEEHQDSRHWEAEDGALLCEDLPAGITQCRACRYDDGEPEEWPCAELRALEAVIGDE